MTVASASPLAPSPVGCALRSDPDGAQSAPYDAIEGDEPSRVAGGEAAASPRSGTRDADPTWAPAPRGWYLSLLAGTLPMFVLGMAASALADRLAFAGWALVAGFGYALLLRAAWSRGWSAAGRAALVLGWAALALLAFATLVERHREILDLGYRALLWPIYSSLLTRPSTWRVAAALLAAGAIAAFARAAVARRARSTG